MQEILFNSRIELDKQPVGAVKENTELRIGLRIAQSAEAKELSLIIQNDSTGNAQTLAMEPVWSENGYTRYELSFKSEAPGLYWYWFSAATGSGERLIGRGGDGAAFSERDALRAWQLSVYSHDYTTPEWIRGGVFYHIFVDRFNKKGALPLREGAIARDDWGGTPFFEPDEAGVVRNNDFFGGNLEGIAEKLPYLKELGVSCIYLSPVFEAASNHKYDTSDYMNIDPSFGDEEAFRSLCEAAAALDIRVICDGVFNHTGDDSRYFDRYGHYGGNGAYNSKSSPYYSWYSFSNWPDEYESWWGISTLPQVREDNPDYRRFIFGDDGVLRHWMRAGASGWRLDVADELPDEFLRELRETVKDENPDAIIIGEVWEDASTKLAYGKRRHYFDGGELDSVMNYPFKEAIISYMLSGRAEAIAEAIEAICENYPKPALDCLMNGLGTHDTPRILTVLGGKSYETKAQRAEAFLDEAGYAQAKDKLKAASLLQCALPGVPCIYYGDEAGLQGYEDPFNRRCYPWGREDGEILSWYKEILRVRRENAAFAGGDYRTLKSDGGVFAFERQNGESRVLVCVNMSGESKSLSCGDMAAMLVSFRAEIAGNQLVLEPGGCAAILCA